MFYEFGSRYLGFRVDRMRLAIEMEIAQQM